MVVNIYEIEIFYVYNVIYFSLHGFFTWNYSENKLYAIWCSWFI